MTVEEIIKELSKIANQQLPVYFKTGEELVPAGVVVSIDQVTKETIGTLEGFKQAAILTRER